MSSPFSSMIDLFGCTGLNPTVDQVADQQSRRRVSARMEAALAARVTASFKEPGDELFIFTAFPV